MEPLDDEVEDVLRRQDEARQLLEHLRSEEPILGARGTGVDRAGRRDFRRWPAPEGVMLKTLGVSMAALVLADVMWRDGADGGAGIRFEFYNIVDRKNWADGLIDALLARFAVR